MCLTKHYTEEARDTLPIGILSNSLGSRARWNQRNVCYERFTSNLRFIFVSYASRLFLEAGTAHEGKAKLKFRESKLRSLPASFFSPVRHRPPDRRCNAPRIKKPLRVSKGTLISASPRVRDERNITKRLSIFSFGVRYIAPWRGITEPKLHNAPATRVADKEEGEKRGSWIAGRGGGKGARFNV